MRYIQIGNKTVAVYSEHYRQRNPIKTQNRIRKGGKNNNMNRPRKPFYNSKSKHINPRKETNKNTQNENISPVTVNQQQTTTNPSRTPLEKFVEAIRNLQRIMTDDMNFTRI